MGNLSRRTNFQIAILLFCCLVLYHLVKSDFFWSVGTTTGKRNPLKSLKEGCIVHPKDAGTLSERTGIPEALERAYLKLDGHLDEHAPLGGGKRKWSEERPQGVAAIKLGGGKVNFLWNAIKIHVPNCRTVCEVGLNAGHSSVLWLEACPDSNAVLFDMPYKDWSQATFDFLRAEYDGRITIVEGNSLTTIPDYISNHPDWRCDLIAIDGSKDPSIRYQDFLNFEKVSHSGTLLLLDDASIEIIENDFVSKNRGNLSAAMETNGDLNALYSAMILREHIVIDGACSLNGTLKHTENSTISAHYARITASLGVSDP